jgi:hypothetical protein
MRSFIPLRSIQDDNFSHAPDATMFMRLKVQILRFAQNDLSESVV